MKLSWLDTCSGQADCEKSDVTGDGHVDFSDIEVLTKGWLWPDN